MLDDGTRVTSELLWRSTLLAIAIDIPLLALVGRAVSVRLFLSLRWYLVVAAGVVYAAIWGAVGSVLFWDSVYKAVFPTWSRWLLPVWFGGLFGVASFAFWWLSSRAGRWPAVWFALLGGLASLVGHGIGIRRGLLNVPMLRTASAMSALAFGVFEFVFYWCVIVGLAVGARACGRALGRGRT